MRWQVGGGDHCDPVGCVGFEMLYDHPQARGLVHWEKKAYATFTVQPRESTCSASKASGNSAECDVPCLVGRAAPANRNVKGHASRQRMTPGIVDGPQLMDRRRVIKLIGSAGLRVGLLAGAGLWRRQRTGCPDRLCRLPPTRRGR